MLTILTGDALKKLGELPNESVQCGVTSPPYWGLRDYGTASWEGGDDGCDHKQGRNGSGRTDGIVDERAQRNRDGVGAMGGDCGKCGAKRIDSQLGLEKTPEEYVCKMVEVFREVRRVLRKDGTLWLNLGDSYNSQGGIHEGRSDNQPGVGAGLRFHRHAGGAPKDTIKKRPNRISNSAKPKDLVGIPWMVAFALRADGWYLRQDIIWAKPNPMPESVIDRCTKSHEYIFMLSKSARYYYDADSIREPASEAMLREVAEGYDGQSTKLFADNGAQDASSTKSRIINGARKRIDKQRGHSRRHDGFNDRLDNLTKAEQQAIGSNKRDVWTIACAPYPEAHFATYPPDLIKPCIMAGTRVGDTVLDPFAGSGTTGMVALELGRKAILIELNPKYVELIEQRCNVTPGFL